MNSYCKYKGAENDRRFFGKIFCSEWLFPTLIYVHISISPGLIQLRKGFLISEELIPEGAFIRGGLYPRRLLTGLKNGFKQVKEVLMEICF